MNKKIIITSIVCLLFSGIAYTQGSTTTPNWFISDLLHHSIGFGTALALVISWSNNKSIGLALLHGFFGWVYVLYHFMVRA